MSKIARKQYDELRSQMKAGRITPELLEIFLRNPHSVNSLLPKYSVSVDYNKSVEEMIVAGHYDQSSNNINSTNFKVSGTGIVTVDLELVHFNKVVSSQTVIHLLNTSGKRPAMIEELLSFGATYPEVQQDFPIFSLGSSWRDTEDWYDLPDYVTYLGRHGHKREIALWDFEDDYGSICRFLAVNKSVNLAS